MPTHAETRVSTGENGAAYVEVVEFTPSTKVGLLLPKPAVDAAPWLNLADEDRLDVVLELAEGGRLAIHPAKVQEDRLLPAVNVAAAEFSEPATESSGRTKLIAIGERFARGRLNKGRYLYLNQRIVYHLSLPLGAPCQVIIVAVAGTCEVWTTAFYESVRQRLPQTIQDLCTRLNC